MYIGKFVNTLHRRNVHYDFLTFFVKTGLLENFPMSEICGKLEEVLLFWHVLYIFSCFSDTFQYAVLCRFIFLAIFPVWLEPKLNRPLILQQVIRNVFLCFWLLVLENLYFIEILKVDFLKNQLHIKKMITSNLADFMKRAYA